MLSTWRGPRAAIRTFSALLTLLAAVAMTGCPDDGNTGGRAGRGGARPVKPAKPEMPELPADAPKELKRLVDKGGWLAASTTSKNTQGMWELIHEKTELVFIHVPGGTFEMGTEEYADTKPIRSVTLKPFLLCKTEVSQRAWDDIGGTDDRTRAKSDLPINRIIWDEARSWCRSTGFRLPTEAEWEYAARAGTADVYVSGSPAAMPAHAWYGDNSNNELHPVGKKAPNKWGFHDMAGNVAEWCEDVYADYVSAPTDGSAAATGGEMRVLRGGNYSGAVHKVGSCYRDRNGAGSRFGGPGLRPAVSLR